MPWLYCRTKAIWIFSFYFVFPDSGSCISQDTYLLIDRGKDNKIRSQRTANTVTNKKNLLNVFRNKPRGRDFRTERRYPILRLGWGATQPDHGGLMPIFKVSGFTLSDMENHKFSCAADQSQSFPNSRHPLYH